MKPKYNDVPVVDEKLRNSSDKEYTQKIEEHYKKSSGSFAQKMQSFPRFVSRQQQAIYLFKWELFKEILNVQGSIAEFGVFMGSGMFSFASFSAILEPFNYQRKIIGFDTYEGFNAISDSDRATKNHSALLQKGGFYVSDSMCDELREGAEIFDLNRPIGHIEKLEFVKGDIFNTVPDYIEKNSHLLLSLIYLDLDLYEPTKFALEQLYDRVVPGGIIAFDELNNPAWPGETKAFLEFFKGKSGKLKKCSFEPLRSYFVKE
ncbi:TylF/MycF family methyltransferase [bacterium]|nr:TylF/MycF family methyltransferase [bacterium]